MSLMTTEDVILDAIDDGFLKCEEKFSQELQSFNADLVSAFDYGAGNRLQEIEDKNTSENLGLDMENVNFLKDYLNYHQLNF